MNTLIVRAGWSAHPEWVGAWADAAAGAQAGPAAMRWEGPHQLPACKDLVLVVPAALLSWHRVPLPRLPASRWQAALHGLLEDRLLDDASAMHLALAPGACAGQEVQVAACDKDWITRTLAALARAGRPAARIVPEFEPDNSGVHLLGQPDRGWLVQCGADQVHCLPLSHPVRQALQAWHRLHPNVPVLAEPAMAGLAGDVWGQIPSLMPVGAQLQRAAASRWNLAQFDLSLRSSLHRHTARLLQHAWTAADWKPVRWGLAAVLGVHLLGLQAWAWTQERRSQKLQHEIQGIFRATFPQVPVVLDPLLQMERETQALARASGQSAPGDLAPMLAALAAVPGDAPGRIDFRPGELGLVAWRPDPAHVQAAQARLAPQGYRLERRGDGWSVGVTPPGGAP